MYYIRHSNKILGSISSLGALFPLLDPILPDLYALLRSVLCHEPSIPYSLIIHHFKRKENLGLLALLPQPWTYWHLKLW